MSIEPKFILPIRRVSNPTVRFFRTVQKGYLIYKSHSWSTKKNIRRTIAFINLNIALHNKPCGKVVWYWDKLFPKNILRMEPIAPSTQSRMVFSFDKISVLQGQVFRAYLYESGGTRNYVITFNEKDINKALTL